MRRAGVAIAVLALAGCSVLRAPEADWVDGAVWSAGELRALQRLVLHRDGHSRTLQAVVEASPSGVTVALLDALGRRVLLVQSGREGYTEQRDPRLPRAVDGRAILADLLLVYWPRAELEELLPERFALSVLGAERRLAEQGRAVASVSCTGEPWNGRCVLRRPRGDYRLSVDSRREAP